MGKLWLKIFLYLLGLLIAFTLLFIFETTVLHYIIQRLFKNINVAIESCLIYYAPISTLIFWLSIGLTILKLYLDDNYQIGNAKNDVGRIGRICLVIAIFILMINSLVSVIQITTLLK